MDKPEIKHTPLPWGIEDGHIQSMSESFFFDHTEVRQRVAKASINYSKDFITMTGRSEANAKFIVKACNAYYTNQATITELVEAMEPLIELSWVKANLPNDIPVIVAAEDAVAKAKGQIDG